MKQKVMAIGAHADDIEANIGGTLLKYHDAGYEIVYVMSTNNMSGGVHELQADGTLASKNEMPLQMMARRKRECDDGAALLHATPIHLDHPQRHYWGGEKEGNLELRYGCLLPEGVKQDIPSILTAYENSVSVKKLADLILEKNPECVFTHSVSQYNIEHFATSLLVNKSYWMAVENGFRGALLHWREGMTRLGEFNCRWETFIDYTPYLDRKMELLGMHKCQMPKAHLPEFGHRHLATQWGRACGVGAAEVFVWVRHADYRDNQGIIYEPLTLELIQNTK